jgi:hypothetical protein
VFDVDVRAVAVTGEVRVNGASAPTRVLIRNDEGSVVTAEALDGRYSAVLLPGVYDFEVRSVADCEPFCGTAVARRSLTLAEDGVLDLDVTTAALAGRVTVDGAVRAEPQRIVLTSVAESGDASVTVRSDGTYAAVLPRGRYVVGWESSCGADPSLCGGITVYGCDP